MNEKDREYEELFKIFEQKSTRQARQNTVTSRPMAQNRTQPRSRQQVSRKKQSPRKRRQKKRRIAIISSLAAILLIVCIVLICKSCTGNHDLTTLQGAWHYDEYTEYEFDGKGNGCMCLDEENHFEFTYSVEGDTVKLDFVLDYVTDCEYTFAVEGDTLTLIGGEGTVGGTYELAKVNE